MFYGNLNGIFKALKIGSSGI